MNIWIFILFILNDIQSVIAWSILGLGIAAIVKIFGLKYLTKCSVGYFFTAFAAALLAKDTAGDFSLMAHYSPVFNFRTLVFAFPVISMFLAGILLKSDDKKICNLLKFGAISLCYLYLVGEINSLFAKTSQVGFNKVMTYIILGFIYTLQTKRLYLATKYLLFNIASWIIGVITVLVLLGCSYSYPAGFIPVANLRYAAYAVGITSAIFLAKWTKSEFYKYLAVILGFFAIHSESAGISKFYGGNLEYIISLAWVLYSGAVTIWGILSRRKFLINSGIILSLLTICRIFIYDLAKVEALYKLIAFLALGVILMLVSYIYTKNKN